MSLIHFFEHTDAGAPTLNNAAGSLIGLLDAVLVTGYNSKSVLSITVASGVATVDCTAHGFSNTYGKIIQIAGATGSYTDLNKNTRISGVTTNGFTFLCPGVPDGVATGTITAKYAPLGWVKQFSDTNKAMYKRSDVTATGCMLRIDDTAVGQTCRALMVHSATDINTYTNPCPTAAQIVDGLGQYWGKNTTAAATQWFLVGDSLRFLMSRSSGISVNWQNTPYGFGNFTSFKPADVLNTFMLGQTANGGNSSSGLAGTAAQAAQYIVAGGKDGASISRDLQNLTNVNLFGSTGHTNTYPSDVDGGLVLQYPILISEGTGTAKNVRGVLPMIAAPYANMPQGLIPPKTQISNIVGSEKVFLAAYFVSGFASGTTECCAMLDLTGPWV